jgi:hypothetical protein
MEYQNREYGKNTVSKIGNMVKIQSQIYLLLQPTNFKPIYSITVFVILVNIFLKTFRFFWSPKIGIMEYQK